MLKNTTSYDTREVKRIIQHAAFCIDIKDVAINIKNLRVWGASAGRAYSAVPHHSPWHPSRRRGRGQQARYLITCRIGPPDRYPIEYKGYPGRKIENGHWPTTTLADWKEALVWIVAHELMHIQQFRQNASRTEKETEGYAMSRLKAWRGQSVID